MAESSSNPRGIPVAPFVDNVSDYVSSRADVEGVLKNFQELLSKYTFMQDNTHRRLASLKAKVPDIKAALDMVLFLTKRNQAADTESFETLFSLSDTLYARASLAATTPEVHLWLGANVMLAYPIDEAATLLQDKLDGALKKVSECEEDGDFLREQITTVEVATARVYNWDVTQRRKERDQQQENQLGS